MKSARKKTFCILISWNENSLQYNFALTNTRETEMEATYALGGVIG